jgi:hypothetical protein
MGFSAMTQQDNFSIDADRWLSEQIDKIIAENPLKFLRESRPWIYDIIRVLIGRPRGLSNQEIYREMHSIRDKSGLPMPRSFEATIRSALNSHYSASSQWSGKQVDAILYKPDGRGTWAIHKDKVKPWLASKGFSDI